MGSSQHSEEKIEKSCNTNSYFQEEEMEKKRGGHKSDHSQDFDALAAGTATFWAFFFCLCAENSCLQSYISKLFHWHEIHRILGIFTTKKSLWCQDPEYNRIKLTQPASCVSCPFIQHMPLSSGICPQSSHELHFVQSWTFLILL